MDLNQEPTRQDTIDTAYQLGQMVADAGDFYDVLSMLAVGYRDNHLATGEKDAPPPAYTGSGQIERVGDVVGEPNTPAARARRRRESERHWQVILGTLNEVRSVAESLIADSVGQARRDGLSWDQIGDALEVSKQAARQRYGSPPGVYNKVSGDITEFP